MIPPTPAAHPPANSPTSVLLALEGEARNAPDLDSLRFSIVTLTRQLVAYRQAVILRGSPGRMRVDAVSNVPVLDRNAPFLQWLERLLNHPATLSPVPGNDPTPLPNTGMALRLSAARAPADLAQDWPSFALPDVLWIPLTVPHGPTLGGLWLSREGTWNETECHLLTRLAETYAHALFTLELRTAQEKPLRSLFRPFRSGPHRQGANRPWYKRFAAVWISGALLGLAMIPVPQSALAPVEVVAITPIVVAAPINGVIRSFQVKPNQPVKAGDLLFTFEDESLRADRDIASKTLALAEAERMKAAQSAFSDGASKAEIALHDATIALRKTELAHAEAQLARAEVRAEQDGVVLFSDVNEWIGRPVSIGERVMTLADPNHVELKADLPVSDAIDLTAGDGMRAFLDAAPLSPLKATIRQISYEAQNSQKGVLSFVVHGQLTEPDAHPRLGLKGTARLEGNTVPLALYLLRRPLTAFRQMTGF